MGGLGLLIVVAIYLAIAFKVSKAIKNRKARYVAIAFFALLPTADAIVGRIYLKQLCATEGGLKVFRVVDNVEGFLDTPGSYLLKKYGYSFIEGNLRGNGIVDRVSLRSGGLVVETGVPRKSQYQIRRIVNERGMYSWDQYVVEEIASASVLASFTQIIFKGGWAERLLSGFSDSGGGSAAWCPETVAEARWEQTVVGALRPVTASMGK